MPSHFTQQKLEFLKENIRPCMIWLLSYFLPLSSMLTLLHPQEPPHILHECSCLGVSELIISYTWNVLSPNVYILTFSLPLGLYYQSDPSLLTVYNGNCPLPFHDHLIYAIYIYLSFLFICLPPSTPNSCSMSTGVLF